MSNIAFIIVCICLLALCVVMYYIGLIRARQTTFVTHNTNYNTKVYILWVRSKSASHYTIKGVYANELFARTHGTEYLEFDDYDDYIINERELI